MSEDCSVNFSMRRKIMEELSEWMAFLLGKKSKHLGTNVSILIILVRAVDVESVLCIIVRLLPE